MTESLGVKNIGMSRGKELTAEQRNLLAEAADLTSRANALWLERRYAETEALYRRALGLQERVWGADHPEMASAN